MIYPSNSIVTQKDRSKVARHVPLTIWFTGLSGSGKSTITAHLEKALIERNVMTYRLDGDNLRSGLCKDLGFSSSDRVENIRRAGEVCTLMNQAGLVVLAGFISPHREERDKIREKHKVLGLDFWEVHVNTPLSICIERDPKGLYQKAIKGEIPEFTGVSSPYEDPVNSDYIIDTSKETLENIINDLVYKIIFQIRYHV